MIFPALRPRISLDMTRTVFTNIIRTIPEGEVLSPRSKAWMEKMVALDVVKATSEGRLALVLGHLRGSLIVIW